MKFTIDHDYHIHSHLSFCSSDPEQTVENILKSAKERGLKKICITDHFWDEKVDGASDWYKPQNLEYISKSKPLPSLDGIEVCFGCETEMDKFLTIGIDKSTFDEFDLILIPTTHMHMTGFTISNEDAESNERRAKLWIERLDALLDNDLPFHKVCIVHLTCHLFNRKSREDYLQTLDMIPQSELDRVFTRVAQKGCGVELNQGDMSFSDSEADTVLRIYKTAKKCGCKFYLGSDAHHMNYFDKSNETFARAIDLLDLTEDDKFIF
jgi:histidinol phosphatase-like PHP family hydrolase